MSLLSDVNGNCLEYVSGTFGDQRRFGRRTDAIIQRKGLNPEIRLMLKYGHMNGMNWHHLHLCEFWGSVPS